jgi:hypothetical protein
MKAAFEGAPFSVKATVRLAESGSKGKSDVDYVGVIGSDIRVDPSMLETYCFASPSIDAVDLVTVMGGVRLADRAIKRRHVDGWGRAIHLVVPVFDVDRWSRSSTQNALEVCLSYLTGDAWSFTFLKRRKGKRLTMGHSDHVVKMPDGEYIGVPYSDGLDSYAQARLLSEREPKSRLICTYTDYKGGIQSWRSLCKRREGELRNIYSIPVPFQVTEPHHAEVSFRTRPFIFYGLAAYGTALAGSSRVLIPENGQGSIGGSLVMLGNEAPHRSCYPGFLLRLAQFLSALLGRDVRFEHPGLLQTKGQVLKTLDAVEGSSVWLRKWSCSHDQRHSTMNGRRVHCGVCGGCVLRRMSLDAGGIPDETEYLFSNLDADSFERSAAGSEPVKAMDAMRDVAGNSMRDMQRLADFAVSKNETRLHEVAIDVADATGGLPAVALERVRELLLNHRAEWQAFLNRCGPKSWVQRFAAT